MSWRDWLLSERPQSRQQASLGRAYMTWRRFSANRLAVVGLAIILALVLVAILANVIAPYSPFTGDLRTTRLLPPSTEHWFGTDDLGRDIFSRVIHGSRLTLYIIILVAIIAAPIGLAIGTIAGYAGGWIDAVLMRITDIFLAFPKLILALAFVAALGPGIENAIIAIAITSWPPYARIARAETLTVRNSDYIAAVQADGRFAVPHRAAPHHAALPVVADRARDARHGRHHPHCRGSRFPWPRRAAAAARMGRDDRVGPALHPRPVVGGRHARHRHPRRQPRLQPARRRPARCARSTERRTMKPLLDVKNSACAFRPAPA